MFINGHHPARSGDVVIIKSSGWETGDLKGASHSDWNPYDAHIPLYGWDMVSLMEKHIEM